jgi:hypothetical protein
VGGGAVVAVVVGATGAASTAGAAVVVVVAAPRRAASTAASSGARSTTTTKAAGADRTPAEPSGALAGDAVATAPNPAPTKSAAPQASFRPIRFATWSPLSRGLDPRRAPTAIRRRGGATGARVRAHQRGAVLESSASRGCHGGCDETRTRPELGSVCLIGAPHNGNFCNENATTAAWGPVQPENGPWLEPWAGRSGERQRAGRRRGVSARERRRSRRDQLAERAGFEPAVDSTPTPH